MPSIHAPTSLPLFELQNGAHQVYVFDPRPDPLALGARYVQGGYVMGWKHEGKELTGQPQPKWSSYEGCGLPEVFEWGLGWGDAEVGQEFLRIGAGRMIKQGKGTHESGGPVSQPVEWTVDALDATSVNMVCRDELQCGPSRYAYTLVREIEVMADGLCSTTSLTLECPWNIPVSWFPHPFLAQAKLDETRLSFTAPFDLLDGTELLEEQGKWYYPPGDAARLSRLVPHSVEPFEMTFHSQNQVIQMNLSHPADHVVLFATPQVMSAEPQFARTWPSGLEYHWSVRYTLSR